MALCPEHPKRDQNPKFTPLSETTSIPVGFIWKSPPRGILAAEVDLLFLSSKVFTRLSLERIRKAVDTKLREEQAGFWTERSRTDQIATVRIIIEQLLKWQSRMYVSFVAFKSALDMMDRTVI